MSDIDRLASQVATRQHGAFSTAQLPGVTPKQIHSRIADDRWRPIRQQIFIIGGSPSTWKQHIWVELLTAGRDSVVGTRTALKLHHVRGIAGEPVDILQPEATVPNSKARTSRRTTRLPAWHVTTVEGFPVTTIERSLFDVAGLTSDKRRRRGWATMTEKQVARLVDNAILQGLVTAGSLMRVHRELAGRGRAGTRLMRELLQKRCGTYLPTDSDLEDLFIDLVARYGLPEPQRQVCLGSAAKQIGRVDFYYDEARLIVEADSRAFHGQRDQMLHDHQRDLDLLAQGWQVLRVDWWQLTDDGPNVARQLRRVLERRSAGFNPTDHPRPGVTASPT